VDVQHRGVDEDGLQRLEQHRAARRIKRVAQRRQVDAHVGIQLLLELPLDLRVDDDLGDAIRRLAGA
jgi:hypothetical protein